MPGGEPVVIGFLGGWDRWNDPRRSVPELTGKLAALPGVHAAAISNHRLGTALDLVKKALDSNADGVLDQAERDQACVILYGQSLGGRAAVRLARKLDGMGVPIRLTIQVDSFGFDDDVIPPNVRAAMNYYQTGRLTVRGENEIRAADPSRTVILGNQRREYPIWMLPAAREKARFLFGGGHARMESDPLLWLEIQGLIRAAIMR